MCKKLDNAGTNILLKGIFWIVYFRFNYLINYYFRDKRWGLISFMHTFEMPWHEYSWKTFLCPFFGTRLNVDADMIK